MAIAGAWRAQQTAGPVAYSGHLNDGTGWNAIHGQRNSGLGRNIAPGNNMTAISDSMTQEFVPENLDGYTDEDNVSALWGYGVQDGTADRPHLGESDMEAGTDNPPGQNWPPYGPLASGVPGGGMIRSINRGADATVNMKIDPQEDAQQGWQNKKHGEVNNADVSDPSQYEMQTSMRQRDKVRAGSQRGGGSDSDFSAPVRSRTPGMKARFWSGGKRHEEMLPKAQDVILRPFWLRTAGTGRVQNMQVNTLYDSTPMQRVPPNDVNQGNEAGSTQPYDITSDVYGYTEEDVIY